MTPEEIAAWEPFLKRIPLFGGLSIGEVSRVGGRMSILSLPKGATLYSQGEESDALYIIASGQVRLVVAERGAESPVAVMGRGEVLGEIGVLTGERRTMTVRLDTTCEFLRLKREDFEEVLRDNPTILLHLSRMLSRRLVSANMPAKRSEHAAPQILAVQACLGEKDRALFLLHLALRLAEQSHRKILVLDMTPEPGSVARILGRTPRPLSAEELRRANLRDPANLLRPFMDVLPSGLELLDLPSASVEQALPRGIYIFINFLREAHDLVLVNLSTAHGEVERAVVDEADWVVVAGSEEGRPQFRQALAEVGRLVDPKRIMQAWLGDPDPETPVFAFGSERRVIAWEAGLAEAAARGSEASRLLDDHPRTDRAVERLARRLAGVQVGLAMGSGAALGHSLIGLLKVFKREGIPVDLIAGTSMGAVVGGFIALGLEPEEIEELAVRIDRGWLYENLFLDLTLPRSGLFAGETLLRFLRSHYGTREFSDLELPFACVATDIDTGEEVVLREGRVAEAIRASAGLPLIFRPVRLAGRYLVDGGLVNPVPTQVVADMGADVLLAVSLSMPGGEGRAQAARRGDEALSGEGAAAGRNPSLLDVFFNMIYTMEYGIAQSRTSPAHVVIHPDLAGFHWREFYRARDLIAMGERIAEQYVPQIKTLIPAFADYCPIPQSSGRLRA